MFTITGAIAGCLYFLLQWRSTVVLSCESASINSLQSEKKTYPWTGFLDKSSSVTHEVKNVRIGNVCQQEDISRCVVLGCKGTRLPAGTLVVSNLHKGIGNGPVMCSSLPEVRHARQQHTSSSDGKTSHRLGDPSPIPTEIYHLEFWTRKLISPTWTN